MGTRTRGFANFIGTDGKLQQGSLAAGVGGIAFQAVKTANFVAVAGEGYFVDTTSGAITVTLPSGTPTLGNQIALIDYAGTFDTNSLIINPNGNKIEGATANLQLTGEREGVLLVFTDATQGWLATSGINEGTDALAPVPYTVDFLVIAGGGSGSGNYYGGGGGAGGYRNSFSTESSGGGGSSEGSLSFEGGVVYTITVGAGAAVGNDSSGFQGLNSLISGTGISTITSTGGGAGARYANNGGTGGSGGGGAGSGYTGGSGTANQGYAGGNGAATVSGGGGGAGAVGVNGVGTTSSGNGGAGLASSISGSSVTRAGGGGGGNDGGSYTRGTGGSGGGGDGGNNAAGAAGTINTGSGGGGGAAPGQAGGAGGKGVVILSMPLANFSGTVTGSPTESDDGTTKRLVFNDSGSYTG